MTRYIIALPLALAATVAIVHAQDSDDRPAAESQPVHATYLITGLHCPPCTRTVESSLRKSKGIQSVKVDWRTKNARIEFDEAVLPAQKVAQLIADTPHMMGGNTRYTGWLALSVPEIKDEATADRAKQALANVEGVKRVVTYPTQHSVGVQFAANGRVTSQQLIDALREAGLDAKNLPGA